MGITLSGRRVLGGLACSQTELPRLQNEVGYTSPEGQATRKLLWLLGRGKLTARPALLSVSYSPLRPPACATMEELCSYARAPVPKPKFIPREPYRSRVTLKQFVGKSAPSTDNDALRALINITFRGFTLFRPYSSQIKETHL